MEKLLIVEDDKDLREGLEFAFRSEGYEVLGADRVEKARARLRETPVRASYWTAACLMEMDSIFARKSEKTRKSPF